MKKIQHLGIFFLLLLFVFAAGCKSEKTQSSANNNVQFHMPSADNAATGTTDTSPSLMIPNFTLQDTAQTEPTEPEEAGPSAPEQYKNEYTASGEPLMLYEVVNTGEKATYSGTYERFVYANGALRTCEKWSKSDSGDKLISTTDYTYDGRGNLQSVAERLPAANGDLYTYCKTETVCNTDGTAASKTITYYTEQQMVLQQTEFAYAYDIYGNEILCTVTENGSIKSQTETVYVYDGYSVTEKTENTVLAPETDNSKTTMVTYKYDSRGNVTEKCEAGDSLQYTTTYEYDSADREVGSRTTHENGTVSEYTVTEYDELGGGCFRVTVRRFTEDGALYSTQITCYDQYGNTYIPILAD